MQLAKSILLNRSRLRVGKVLLPVFLLGSSLASMAQDNSPYSRYGLGDATPSTNTTTRAMGGVSAGYANNGTNYPDNASINFSNPASYSQFTTFRDPRTKKVAEGRVILDVGINYTSRTLAAPSSTNKFTSSDVYFSYLQVGIPIRHNWGLSFGLRPLNRISYFITRSERLKDPNTGLPIDSAITQFKGSGGSYLPTIGTGFAIKNFSLGANVGYLFGTRQASTLRSLINDSVIYYATDHTTNTSFGNLFFNAGAQYLITLENTKDLNRFLRLGVAGNWQQNIRGSQDLLRQTFTRGTAGEELQVDSVYSQTDARGTIVYPASYKAGFILGNINLKDGSAWQFGADFSASQWSHYRYFGQSDSVQNSWQVSVGTQITPRPRASYWSGVMYSFGFFAGSDYLRVGNKMPIYGGSAGVRLPFRNYNLNRNRTNNQLSYVNLAFEYSNRGNDNNLLKENMFRISAGFSFTDGWFRKRKYD